MNTLNCVDMFNSLIGSILVDNITNCDYIYNKFLNFQPSWVVCKCLYQYKKIATMYNFAKSPINIFVLNDCFEHTCQKKLDSGDDDDSDQNICKHCCDELVSEICMYKEAQ